MLLLSCKRLSTNPPSLPALLSLQLLRLAWLLLMLLHGCC
jgi:hypothetical protein